MWTRELPAVIVGCLVIALLQGYRPQRPLKETVTLKFNEKVVSYSSDFLRATSFGYARAFSSLLWLRFLQHTPPEKIGSGEVSWMYYDLDAVTDLDPDFLPAYTQGGIFLSVVTEDKLGAEKILLKGAERFPKYWKLHAYLGYHYLYELGEPERASERYYLAGTLPESPPIMKILASSALAKRKGVKPAIELLRSFLKDTKDPEARRRILEKIKKLENERV